MVLVSKPLAIRYILDILDSFTQYVPYKELYKYLII